MATTKCAQPCATCPWLRANQTPEAVRNSPRPPVLPFTRGPKPLRWFDPRNLRRHWRNVQRGGMMPCHATDDRAPLYGGKPAPKGATSRVCVGLAVLAKREVHAFLSVGGSLKHYRKLGGRRMTPDGLASWAARHAFPGAVFQVVSLHDGTRNIHMPQVDDHPDVRVPWSDPVLNKRWNDA